MNDNQRKAIYAKLSSSNVKKMKTEKINPMAKHFDNDRRNASIDKNEKIHVFDMTPVEFHFHLQDKAFEK